ncbi:MAG: nitrogenase component 1 [Peptococcaceae bacterium]|nr:nitrogenase component 1 [Peptococcaceae bacterium]
MRPAQGCGLFGAHQALCGMKNTVLLLHSVVGCSFGTLALHLPGQMQDVRQSCTVISDDEVIFGGEQALEKAIASARELYRPDGVLIISGCVSEMIGDDLRAVTDRAARQGPVLSVSAPGFQGGFQEGFEKATAALLDWMRPCRRRSRRVNLIGLGGDEPRVREDGEAFRDLLCGAGAECLILGHCSIDELREAPAAALNLVLGRGVELARQMEQRFGIPYKLLAYPFGITGARALWQALPEDFSGEWAVLEREMAKALSGPLKTVYPYLQALYGMPAAILASGARADGLRRFLEQELGMAVVCCARRESLGDQEEFYDRVRRSESALLFASSFEQDLAEELSLPLVRVDYPVFDRVALSGRPLIGARGTLCLLEDILNAIMEARTKREAVYR